MQLYRSIVLAALGFGLATAALADVLVLKDGNRVDTKGKYEVRGRRVVFSDSQGKLVALRLDEVDLAASEAAGRPESAAAAAAAPAAKPKKAPVLVLTDRDVAQAASNEAVATAPIVMYTTSWCGYCRKARALFGELGIAFQDLDIEKDRAALRAKDRLDASCGVPLIDFGGEVICGFREDRIRELAAQRKAAEKSPDTDGYGDGEV